MGLDNEETELLNCGDKGSNPIRATSQKPTQLEQFRELVKETNDEIKREKVELQRVEELQMMSGFDLESDIDITAKNRVVHTQYTKDTEKGREFIALWNKGNRKGYMKVMAKHFGISIPTIYRIRVKLGLPDLCSKEHIGRAELIRKIKKAYFKGYTSYYMESNMRLAGFGSENIRKILISEGVKMKPQYCTNAMYYKTRSGIPPNKLIKEIKRKYLEEHMTLRDIATDLKVDAGTISTKLKAMGIQVEHKKPKCKGGYPCNWCNKIMVEVYQNKGLRKQKYCDNSCKNKAKDFRRMVRGGRCSENRLNSFENFLKKCWGDTYDKARKRLLTTKPIIVRDKNGI